MIYYYKMIINKHLLLAHHFVKYHTVGFCFCFILKDSKNILFMTV